MVQQGFSTYARLRPFRVKVDDPPEPVWDVQGPSRLLFTGSIEPSIDEYRDRSMHQESCDFQFTKIFDEESTQEELFETVGRELVMGALQGYNGTIFGYGQTGSGKTFSITGGDRYKDRGIVPRAIEMLFTNFKNHAIAHDRKDYTCYITYMEIYNENVYDLLDRAHQNLPIEKWSKVKLLDDQKGDLQFFNLGVYEARTEDEALKLLFLGNVNRVTSATIMNQASSRSHAIFSLTIEGRNIASKEVTTSKLHLVDLAGSERIYKMKTSHKIKKEGKHINLSLHYLEQVVRALHKKTSKDGHRSGHIPYRNSMLTSVLRDSLGGNCRSVFLATLNPESSYAGESLSTCKFMQRCSQIEVEVIANKEVDLHTQIQLLSAENQQLRVELNTREDEIRTQMASFLEEKPINALHCKTLVDDFMHATTQEAYTECMERIREMGVPNISHCLEMLKTYTENAVLMASEVKELFEAQSEQVIQLQQILKEERHTTETMRQELGILKEESTDTLHIASREEEERATENSNETIRRQIELLQGGAVFIKHGRRGKPHPRFVWSSNDLKCIHYRKLGGTGSKNGIPVDAITTIKVGCSSSLVLKRTKKDIVCFSIHYSDNRSLDLQVDEGDTLAQKEKRRDEWIAAFRFLVELHEANCETRIVS